MKNKVKKTIKSINSALKRETSKTKAQLRRGQHNKTNNSTKPLRILYLDIHFKKESAKELCTSKNEGAKASLSPN